MSSILLIEDDIAFCKMLETFLSKNGFEVVVSFTAVEAQKLLSSREFDLVITDVRLPDDDGLDILKSIRSKRTNSEVILMTGYAEVDKAVEAIKEGAFDYISKPFRPDKLLEIVNKALDKYKVSKSVALPSSSQLSSNNENGPQTKKIDTAFLKGVSNASLKLEQHIDLVAPTTMSILITGQSGTGKEYVAKSIHDRSKRHNMPFVAVDCGAIPKEIAGSEFFGHLKGSFTGAVSDKIGHFEAAHQGTLFLDEIGNLSYELQVQLLRALQERKVKPVGGTKEVEVDIRVITATNENLQKAVKDGDFREDLYHRLNEFSVEMPSLKEREEDLMLFVNLFLDQANAQLDKQVLGFTEDAEAILRKYDWPGNLRQLRNVVKRCVLMTQGSIIPQDILPKEIFINTKNVDNPFSLHNTEDEQERILDALKKSSGNKSKAARLLNIDRKTLYNKLKLYGIRL